MTQSNMYDAAKLKEVNKALDEVDQRLESEKGAYMSRCKAIKEERKEIFADAKANGIPVKVLKAVRERDKLHSKADELRENLDEEVDICDQMELQLGFIREQIEEQTENAASA